MTDQQTPEPERMSTGQLILQSWDKLLSEYRTLALAVLVYYLGTIVVTGIALLLTIEFPWSPVVVIGTFTCLYSFSYFALASICLAIVRKQPVKVFSVPSVPKLANWLLATVVFLLALSAGSILLVLPGIIAWIYLSVYGFAICDGDDAISSLRTSYRIVRGQFWRVFIIAAIFAIPLVVCTIPVLWGVDTALNLVLTLTLASIYNDKLPATKDLDA